MSSIFNFTDNQWYNFICGLYAGLRLKNLELPPYESDTILYPIPVGGYGKIGLAIPKIQYEPGVTSLSIPVYTHDVDIGYSGFSVNISWDATRLSVQSITAGDFGTIGSMTTEADIRYTLETGRLKAIGLRNSNIVFNQPVILFYMNVTLLDEVTRGNPIDLRLNDNGYKDTNYCSMLKWVDIGEGEMYTFYITPLLNVSGGIFSDLEDNSGSLGDDTVIAAPGSISGVYIGSAFTAPGTEGVVPIVACSNVKDKFPFVGVKCSVEVDDDASIFTYIHVEGCEGFSVNYTTSILDNGHLKIDIEASRSEGKSDSVTFCYIRYRISSSVSEYYIPLKNLYSALVN